MPIARCRRTDRSWHPTSLLLLALMLGQPAWSNDALEAPPPTQPTQPTLDTQVMVPRLEVSEPEGPPQDEADGVYAGEDTDSELDDPEAEVVDVEPVPTVAVTAPEPLEPPPLARLEIMLDWYPSPRHAALILAGDNGALTRNGLEVVLSTPADPNVPTRMLAAGRIDLAVTRQPLLHLQVDRGLPLVRVATLVSVPLAALILRENQDDVPLARLAGQRIGYSDEDGRDILLPMLIQPHGIRSEELTLLDANFDLATAMIEGQLDGLIGSMRLQLPRMLGDEGVSTRMLRVEEHGVPLHDGLILVANRDRLNGQKPSIRKLIAALEETTAWMIEYPDEAWQRLVEAEPGIDTPANREAWPDILRRFTTRPAAMDQQRYGSFERLLHDRGLVSEETPVYRLAVDPWAP